MYYEVVLICDSMLKNNREVVIVTRKMSEILIIKIEFGILLSIGSLVLFVLSFKLL